MKVVGALRSLVNARGLQAECARVVHEALLVFVLLYDGEKMLKREKKRFKIMTVQMVNLRGLLNVRVRGTKGMDERIDENVLHWFSNLERIGNHW